MEEFNTALTAARAELARLRRERQQLDTRIAKMEQLVGALNTVQSDNDTVEMSGITDAVRAVLKSSWYPLAPTEVRDHLVDSGFHFIEKYGENLLPSVHVILKRLVKSNEVIPIDNPYDSTKKYWWLMNGAPQTKPGTLSDLMKLALTEGSPVDIESPSLRNALMEQLGSASTDPPQPRRRKLSDLIKDK